MLGSLILALLLLTATVLYFYGNRLLHILVVTVIRQITGGMPVHPVSYTHLTLPTKA